MKKQGVFMLFAMLFHALLVGAQDKRALLIGISEYPEIYVPGMSWDDIHGANDVDLLKQTLKKQGFSITTLTNSDATAANIRKEFKRLLYSCKSGDMVMVHFSGHGQPYEDLSHDEADGWDESIVPYDAAKKYVKGRYEGKNHIADDELGKYFDSLRQKVGRKGFVYVVLDACHAGTAYRDDGVDTTLVRGTYIGFTPNKIDYAGFKINRQKNFLLKSKSNMADICVIEACQSHQVNQEIKVGGTYYGPLSYYVNKVLSRHNLTHDIGWVDMVRKEMERLQRQTMVVETSVK